MADISNNKIADGSAGDLDDELFIEVIPNEDKLYYRVHKTVIRGDGIIPGAIKMQGEGIERGMSTNWSKYSNAEASKIVAKVPGDNGVISFNVGYIRSFEMLQVEHNPVLGNRAHSHVLWKDVDETEVRQKLSNKESYEWEIKYA